MILVEILKFLSTLFLFKTGLGILLDEVKKKKGFLRYKNDILTLSKKFTFSKDLGQKSEISLFLFNIGMYILLDKDLNI